MFFGTKLSLTMSVVALLAALPVASITVAQTGAGVDDPSTDKGVRPDLADVAEPEAPKAWSFPFERKWTVEDRVLHRNLELVNAERHLLGFIDDEDKLCVLDTRTGKFVVDMPLEGSFDVGGKAPRLTAAVNDYLFPRAEVLTQGDLLYLYNPQSIQAASVNAGTVRPRKDVSGAARPDVFHDRLRKFSVARPVHDVEGNTLAHIVKSPSDAYELQVRDADSGELRWKTALTMEMPAVAVDRDVVFVFGRAGEAQSLRAEDGRLMRKMKYEAEIPHRMIIVDKGLLIYTHKNRRVVAMNIRTGRTAWVFPRKWPTGGKDKRHGRGGAAIDPWTNHPIAVVPESSDGRSVNVVTGHHWLTGADEEDGGQIDGSQLRSSLDIDNGRARTMFLPDIEPGYYQKWAEFDSDSGLGVAVYHLGGDSKFGNGMRILQVTNFKTGKESRTALPMIPLTNEANRYHNWSFVNFATGALAHGAYVDTWSDGWDWMMTLYRVGDATQPAEKQFETTVKGGRFARVVDGGVVVVTDDGFTMFGPE